MTDHDYLRSAIDRYAAACRLAITIHTITGDPAALRDAALCATWTARLGRELLREGSHE